MKGFLNLQEDVENEVFQYDSDRFNDSTDEISGSLHEVNYFNKFIFLN